MENLVKDQMTLVQQPTMPLNNCEVKEGGGEVKVTKMPWFHGKISREVAEKLLTPRTDGLFLASASYQSPDKDRIMIQQNSNILPIGERVHKLPRRLHPLCLLRVEGGALQNHPPGLLCV